MSDQYNDLYLRNSIEAAFDTDQETEQPVVETPEPIETTEQKEERVRDEKGKFSKAETPIEIAPEVPEVKPPKQSPKAYKKEIADKYWDKLDPEFQDELLRREESVEKGFEGYKNHAELGRTVETTLSPYMATINKFGVTPDVAIKELFNSDHILRYGSEQEKVGMMQRIFKDYGINPESVFNSLQQGQQQIDPKLQPVYQELNSLKQQQQNWLREQQERENSSLTSEINRLKEGKEHFELVRNDMAGLLNEGMAKDFNEAYDMAIWARPDLRATLLQQERKTAEDTARNEALKRKQQNASGSLNGSSPVSTASASTENLRDIIANQFN
jgi:hypothetical protein